MYIGTLGINIYLHSINCPTLTQFQCKIWMSINRVATHIFGVNDPHSASMEEFAFDTNLAQGWCGPLLVGLASL